jgi:hypothetical protein
VTHLSCSEKRCLIDVEISGGVVEGDGGDDDGGGARKFHDARLGDDDDEIDGGMLLLRGSPVLFYELQSNGRKTTRGGTRRL